MTVLKLKKYRELSKLSQREIAVLLDIAQAHYWNWEKGLSLPNAKQIIKLCQIFQCSPNDLFGFTGVYIVTSEEVH